MAKKSKPSSELLDVPVKYKSFGYGGGRTCRLGVSIDGNELTEKLAKHYMGGAQLDIKLTLDPEADKDIAGQKKLIDTTPEPVEAVCDCKGYSYADKHFTGGLTFAYEDVEAEALLALAGKSGRLVATRTGDCGEKAKGDEPEGGDDEE